MDKSLTLSSAIALALCGAAAHSQNNAPLPTVYDVEEVLVTAERRTESLQSTPLSIVAFSGGKLESANIRNIDDLQAFVPNMSVGGSVPVGNSAPNFSIRGVGQTSGRANNEKGVGLYVDDIYYPRSTGAIVNLLDVERIEVLRGPQGTLFGRNTIGGAIRYISKKPTDQLEGNLTVTYGEFDRTDLEGLVNVPLGEKAALRAQGVYFKRDGYVDLIGTGDALGDVDDYAGRVTLRLKPSDALTIDLTGAYSESKSNGSPTVITNVGLTQPNGMPIGPVAAYSQYLQSIGQAPITVNDPRFVSPDGYSTFDSCIMDQVALDPTRFGNAPNLLTNAIPRSQLCNNRRSNESTFASADVNWKITDNLAFRSLTGYNEGTDIDMSDYGLLGAQTNLTVNDMESYSQELQLLGDYQGFKWVAGLYYFHETPAERRFNREVTRDPVTGQAECCIGFDANVQLETDSYAIFGQGTYNLTQKSRVTAGVRYSYDEKNVSINKVGIFFPPLPPGGTPQTNADNWDSVDYRLTLDYRFTEQLMTYATVSKGFKSGGFNIDITSTGGQPPRITSFDPETVVNFELGLRSQMLDNRLRVNLTGFYMNYDDLVVQLADFSRGALQVLFLNAGELDLYGGEAEIVAAVTQGLRLSVAAGYTDIDYKNLPPGSPLLIQASCPTTRPATFQQCAAQDLARSPELTYTAGLDYTHQLGQGAMGFSANYAFKDDQFSNNSTSNSILLPSYGVLNVRLEYDSAASWKIAAFATNVLDEEYITTGTNGVTNVLGTRTQSPGRPREWGVAATWQF